MRITGGIFKGRRLASPSQGVRPTKDFVREALFSILSSKVIDCVFVDLFAGTGAVGLEAASRGAGVVCGVEENRACLKVLRRNIEVLGPAEYSLVESDVISFLDHYGRRVRANVMFADPPYDKGDDREGWSERLLGAIEKGECLAQEGWVVIEQSSETVLSEPGGWVLFDKRTYGKTALGFYARA